MVTKFTVTSKSLTDGVYPISTHQKITLVSEPSYIGHVNGATSTVGEIQIYVPNAEGNKFELGAEYYVDFTKAGE